MSFIKIFWAIFFPPLAVWDKGCGTVIIVFLLTWFGWIPGVIAAFVFINRKGHGEPRKPSKKAVDRFCTKINDLYEEKNYQKLIDSYESNPEMQALATEQSLKNYVLSLWHSGNQDKAVKMSWEYRKKIGEKTYSWLKAMSYENEGDLKEAASFYRRAELNDEANRLQDIVDANENKLIGDIDEHYCNKEYSKVVELFESNQSISNRDGGEKAVMQYINSIHETAGVCAKLNDVIERYSTLRTTQLSKWQAEYHESKGLFFEAANYYQKAGLKQDQLRMFDKETERKRVEEEQRVAREKEQARALEAQGDYEAASNKYKELNLTAECERLADKVREQRDAKQKQKEEYTKRMQEYLTDAVEGCDENDLDRAIEYAQKAGVYDYETASKLENVKNAIRCMNNEEYRDAKRYFNKAGITHWDSELDDIIEALSGSSYSSYGGSGGCSECSNACAGSCGRSCSNNCGGSCTSSCGGSCSYGGSGGRRKK